MRYNLRLLLPERSFVRKLSMLASGTIVGQFLVIASSPLLTRFFTPEEFGFFAVFSALSSIIGMNVAMRFEFAIPVVDNDDDAAAMVRVVAIVSTLSTLLITILVWSAGDWFARLVEAPALALWLWLLPPAVLIWGMGSALSYWSVRRSTYRVNGLNRTLQLGSQAGGQVVFGLLGVGAPGLIVGYLFGYSIRLGHYLLRLPLAERRLLLIPSANRILQNARQHWRYPAFACPSSLLQGFCQLSPAVLLAVFYGPAIAGFYALSQRMLGLPARMLSEAASQVFLGEMRGLDGAALHRYFLRTLALFASLGLVGVVPVLFLAPPLFAAVFGEAWREAGIIVQLLVPLYFARFIVQPISQILHVLKRHDLHFLSNSLMAASLILIFTLADRFDLSAHTTILCFSLTSASALLFQLSISWYLVYASIER